MLAQHYSNTGSAVYLAAAPQQTPNTVSMLAQRIRRWPAIETALGDCPLFGRAAALLCCNKPPAGHNKHDKRVCDHAK